jgi:cell division protein FtsB
MTGSADLTRLREAEIEALRNKLQELEEENKQLKKIIYDLQSNIKKQRS